MLDMLSISVISLMVAGSSTRLVSIECYHEICIWPRLENTENGCHCHSIQINAQFLKHIFMRLMMEVLRLFIGKFVVVYFDKILVFGADPRSYRASKKDF